MVPPPSHVLENNFVPIALSPFERRTHKSPAFFYASTITIGGLQSSLLRCSTSFPSGQSFNFPGHQGTILFTLGVLFEMASSIKRWIVGFVIDCDFFFGGSVSPFPLLVRETCFRIVCDAFSTLEERIVPACFRPHPCLCQCVRYFSGRGEGRLVCFFFFVFVLSFPTNFSSSNSFLSLHGQVMTSNASPSMGTTNLSLTVPICHFPCILNPRSPFFHVHFLSIPLPLLILNFFFPFVLERFLFWGFWEIWHSQSHEFVVTSLLVVF